MECKPSAGASGLQVMRTLPRSRTWGRIGQVWEQEKQTESYCYIASHFLHYTQCSWKFVEISNNLSSPHIPSHLDLYTFVLPWCHHIANLRSPTLDHKSAHREWRCQPKRRNGNSYACHHTEVVSEHGVSKHTIFCCESVRFVSPPSQPDSSLSPHAILWGVFSLTHFSLHCRLQLSTVRCRPSGQGGVVLAASSVIAVKISILFSTSLAGVWCFHVARRFWQFPPQRIHQRFETPEMSFRFIWILYCRHHPSRLSAQPVWVRVKPEPVL